MPTFAFVNEQRKQLPCGVMVARRILVPPVRVRILPRQLKERAKSRRLSSFFFFYLSRKC